MGGRARACLDRARMRADGRHCFTECLLPAPLVEGLPRAPACLRLVRRHARESRGRFEAIKVKRPGLLLAAAASCAAKGDARNREWCD